MARIADIHMHDRRSQVFRLTYTERKEEKKMALKFAIQTVFEIAVVVLIIYGFIHEDKLIAFEDSLKRRIKKRGDKRHVRDSGNRS